MIRELLDDNDAIQSILTQTFQSATAKRTKELPTLLLSEWTHMQNTVGC